MGRLIAKVTFGFLIGLSIHLYIPIPSFARNRAGESIQLNPKSLLLLKPTMAIAHEGEALKVDSFEYNLIRD